MSGRQPVASRPYMPGYGTKPPDEGTGLLPWSWAEEQLNAANNYWVASNGADGQPHVSPVWGVWDGKDLVFSCATTSRKARNLAADSRCTVAAEDAYHPVVIEGTATLITDMERRLRVLSQMNAKYDAEIPDEFFAMDANAVFALRPRKVFGLDHDDFDGSPTRWVFANS